MALCYDLVKGSIVADAPCIVGLRRPGDLVAMTVLDLWLFEKNLVLAMHQSCRLVRYLFEALLWHMSHLEMVLRSPIVLHRREKSLIVFSPELLCLLEQES